MLYVFDEFDLLGEDFALLALQRDGLLSEQRRAAVSRFAAQSPKLQSVASYLLLRYGLEKEFGICEAVDFDYDEHGKPLLAKFPHIHFNLSHCKCAAACAISSEPVGVDVERIAPVKDSLARRVLTAEEYEGFQGAENRDEFFARLWTQKEAYLKLTGQGVGKGLLGSPSGAGGTRRGASPTMGSGWHLGASIAELTTFRGKDYFCSVTDVNIEVEMVSAAMLKSMTQ